MIIEYMYKCNGCPPSDDCTLIMIENRATRIIPPKSEPKPKSCPISGKADWKLTKTKVIRR